MSCPKCGYADVPAGSRFCPRCRAVMSEPPGTRIDVKQDVNRVEAGGDATALKIAGRDRSRERSAFAARPPVPRHRR